MENTYLVGLFLEKKMQQNKYNISFDKKVLQKNIERLINQIWKLIPMKEKGEDWEKHLSTVIIEITGYNEIFYNEPIFLSLLAKLEGLSATKDNFDSYRKTIFENITIL